MKKLSCFLSGDKLQLKNYVLALKKHGITPCFDQNENCDGLILTGGGDVKPCLYNKMGVPSTMVDLQRDITELYLIKKYLSERKPIVGICRGLQIINVFFGGTLKLVKNQIIHSRTGGKKDKIHANKSINGTFCQNLFGNLFTVNSAHHQCVDQLASALKPCALSVDGEIEAVSFSGGFAVQFHPERMGSAFNNRGELIFEYYKTLLNFC